MSRNAIASIATSILFVLAVAFSSPANAQTNVNACGLLSASDIARATGLRVHEGKAGAPMAGAIGNCKWMGSKGTAVIVTLGDTQHMQVTMQSQLQAGASPLPGIGASAVETKGTDETEGGYNISFLDSKGGVGVSIRGGGGTSDRTIALAKLIATHR
jgi:hypothetical protein